MPGVVGGVSARALEPGQAPLQYPDLLSAATTLVQSGGGAYARLINALQSLDQGANILQLLNSLVAQGGDITTLQGQVATLQGQVATLNGQVTTLQGQVTTLQGQMATANANIATLQGQVTTLNGQVTTLQTQLDGVSFGAVGATVPSIAAGNIATTIAGTPYLLPLYSS